MKKNNIDIDAVLHEIKHTRAAMSVMVKSIDGLIGDDFNFFELEAMVFQARTVFENNTESLNQIITTMRKGGAKDIDMRDSEEREATQ